MPEQVLRFRSPRPSAAVSMNTDASRLVTPDARPLFMIADAIPELGSFADIDRYFRVDINVARKNVNGGKVVSEVSV